MPLMPIRHVAIVGAGIGGLAAAAVLAHDGMRVTLLERAPSAGGKLRTLDAGGRAVDAGPTVFTLRPWFEALLARVGESLGDHLRLLPLPLLARHAWADGARLDLHADLEATVDAIGAFAGPADASHYRRFCVRSRRIFDALEAPFMRAPRPTPLTLVARAGLSGLPGLLRIAPFARLWRELEHEFDAPRLRQLFGRYATYCGSSPWLAPATLMLVAHAERAGVWRIDGGMHCLADALARLAQSRGATLRCAAPVARIRVARGRAAGVELADGEHIDADAVLFNGDAAALAQGRLGDAVRTAVAPTDPSQRSLSALTWTGLAQAEGFALAHHNVFFADDYASEFADLFGTRRLPRAPTVYVCAQDRDGVAGTAGAERLLCLVNAPAQGDCGGPSLEEIDTCEQATFAHLRRCGLELDWIAPTRQRTTPAMFEASFPGTGGALYGQATHGWQASFRRPGSRSRIEGLFLAGGSVHPGPGLPMAATSGWLAAEAILAQHARRTSTSGWSPAAMPGGISTP
jgi:1-hydroxycarotenoid 3,4-desaturase